MADTPQTTRILPPHLKPTLDEALAALHERHCREIAAVVAGAFKKEPARD